MSKKTLVALVFVALALTTSAPDRTRLHAQSGASLVISEFRPRGPAGGNDEFVELFNPTGSAVDIGGWKILGSNNAGTNSVRATVPVSTVLGPGCYFLATNTAASGYSGTVAGNVTYTTGITDDGGIALTRSDNSMVDQVGMSAGSAFGEGHALASFGATNADRAYARTPTSGSDTDDNAADFVMTTPSGPQNLASIPGCAAPPVDQGEAVISQVYGGGGNSGSVFTNDFIEIFNPGPDPLSLSGWSVQYRNERRVHLVGECAVRHCCSRALPPRAGISRCGGTTPLPAPDSIGTIAMSASDGKVALVRSVLPLAGACPAGGDLVDLVRGTARPIAPRGASPHRASPRTYRPCGRRPAASTPMSTDRISVPRHRPRHATVRHH